MISGLEDGVTFDQPEITTGVIECGTLQDFGSICALLEVDFNPHVLDIIKRPQQRLFGPMDWSKIPADTKAKLFTYQKQGVEDIVELFDGKCILSAEMGMGKTPWACCVATYYGGSILVVTPKSVVSAWVNEMKRWVHIDLDIIKTTKSQTSQFSVTTYDTAKVNKHILDYPWNVVIFDESHFLKNPDSMRAKNLLRLTNKARCVLMLSATPRLKSNSELYNQLLPILGLNVLGTYEHFIQRYCSATRVQQYRKVYWELGRERYIGELNALMRHAMIRVHKDKNDLPPKKRIIHTFSLTDPIVLGELARLQNEFRLADTRDKKNAITMAQWRLSGIAKAPFVLQFMLQWLSEHENDEKLVVFAHSTAVIAFLHQGLEARGYTTAIIQGETSMAHRQAIITQLSSPTDFTTRVGLLSYGTCAMGITLCPGIYTLLMAELVHTPAIIEQSEDKAHRVGATKPVTCYWMYAENSNDRSVMNLIQNKTNANSQVLDGRDRRLQFDPDEVRERTRIWKDIGLFDMEIEQVRISKLGNETNADYVRRCCIEVEQVDEDGEARIVERAPVWFHALFTNRNKTQCVIGDLISKTPVVFITPLKRRL